MPYADRGGLYLLNEVYDAFVRMHEAARKDGIRLVIVSATRNFNAQKRIWERKWTGIRRVDGQDLAQTVPDPIDRARIILRYSAMPGTSRHHWGTDIDINSVENAYFESPEGRKVYAWLAANARDFGFCQPYTAKGNDRPRGYEEEPWHWSYCPIARHYLQQYVQKSHLRRHPRLQRLRHRHPHRRDHQLRPDDQPPVPPGTRTISRVARRT